MSLQCYQHIRGSIAKILSALLPKQKNVITNRQKKIAKILSALLPMELHKPIILGITQRSRQTIRTQLRKKIGLDDAKTDTAEYLKRTIRPKQI